MSDWHDIIVKPESPIRRAIEIIDNTGKRIALVVSVEGRLLGVLTDGDIRRGILRGIPLELPVTAIMNTKPLVALNTDSREKIFAILKQKRLQHIPIINSEGLVQNLILLDDLVQGSQRNNPVFLLAGGQGTRLQPLTNDTPKPLLKVGPKPILEQILESFVSQGFQKFYISLNYKGEMIREYFGDGTNWGADIRYVRESEPLGTAGPIGLLSDALAEPMIVMNGDLVTRVNFSQLLEFHAESQSSATMCVQHHEIQIPYGVVNIEHHLLTRIEEKPVQRFLVNAGIYVLEPSTLEMIPKNKFLNITTLFEQMLGLGRKVSIFPIREYWLDIGRLEDFRRANEDFGSGTSRSDL